MILRAQSLTKSVHELLLFELVLVPMLAHMRQCADQVKRYQRLISHMQWRALAPLHRGCIFVTFSKQIGSAVLDSMTKMEAQTRDLK